MVPADPASRRLRLLPLLILAGGGLTVDEDPFYGRPHTVTSVHCRRGRQQQKLL